LISATIDTSVYVRALHLGGPSALLLGYARAGELRIDLSGPILDETLRVLREKFTWDGYSIHHAREKLLALTNVVSPQMSLNAIPEDPSDNRVLECAATADSDFIVSEDKDLLRLGQFGRARILTVREFVRTVLAPSRPAEK